MNSDGSRCGEKTINGTGELSVKVAPQESKGSAEGAAKANKRREFSTGPRGRPREPDHNRPRRDRMARVSPGRYHARSFLQARPSKRQESMSSYTTNEIRGGM